MSRQRRMKPKRIYYGPPGAERSMYWKVNVRPATQDVTVNGAVLHALRGMPGVTIGCGLSNMAADNANAFPHPVYLASFTDSTALIVSNLKKDGSPKDAVIYAHNYKHIADANDRRVLKRMVKEDPATMEREFTLRAYRIRPGRSGATAGKTPPERKGTTDRGKTFVPRGALARAVRAGRIGKHVAQQIADVAKRR